MAIIKNPAQAPKIRPAAFKSGDVIFHEGSSDNCAYLITEGRVEILKQVGNGKVVLATMGKNEIFGEVAFFDNQIRTATAKALDDAKLLVFTRDLLDAELQKLQPWTATFLKVLVGRVRTANYNVNPFTDSDYASSFVRILQLCLRGEGQKVGEQSVGDAKAIERTISKTLLLPQVIYLAIEKQLLLSGLLSVELNKVYEKAYVCSDIEALGCAVDYIADVKELHVQAGGTYHGLVNELVATKERELAVLTACVGLMPQGAEPQILIPLDALKDKELALQCEKLLKAPPRNFPVQLQSKDDQKNLFVQRAALGSYQSHIQRQLRALRYTEKLFATS